MGLVLRGLGPFKRYSSSIAGSSTKNPTQYYSERRVLGFSAAEMFTVVSQVERYDTFVPWCNKSTVIQKSNQGREVKAKLEIGFPSLMGESYTSHIQLFSPYLVSAVASDLSTFNKLRTAWKFTPIEENPRSCTLDFAVTFQFRNHVHSVVTGFFFDKVIKQNVNAFLAESERRFGKPSLPEQEPVIFAKKG